VKELSARDGATAEPDAPNAEFTDLVEQKLEIDLVGAGKHVEDAIGAQAADRIVVATPVAANRAAAR